MIFQSQIPGDQFRTLKFLRLVKLDAQAISPYWFLQNISNLEELVIQDMSLRVIFPDERPQDENGEIEIKTRLEMLTLYRLYELRHICKEGCQLDPVLEVLEYLHVDQCSNLKHLVPSSVTFNHLTYLEVQNCNGLIFLITSSTARSLVNLTTLKIIKCDLVEQIVEEAGRESINEIAFNSLEVLELDSLSKLKMFCSSNCLLKLPLLEKLVIRRCPRMTRFSTRETSAPMLQKIVTDEEEGIWCWEGDLNKTVNKMFQDKVAFRSLEHLELSKYPEFKEVWYSHDVHSGVFDNLKTLAVQDCDFLSDVLLPLNMLQGLPNLEVVDVSDCNSLEAVFDLTNMNDKLNIHLKTITLSRLPGVKHIWKQNYRQNVSFDNCQGFPISKIQGTKETAKEDKVDLQHQQQASYLGQVLLPKLEKIIIEKMENLETIWHPVLTPYSMASFGTLDVKNCQKIEHIFPIYMHGVFATLETLKVENCNSVHEIFQLGVNEICSGDDTTRLKNISLLQLPKLKQIWSRDSQSSLSFKSLQVVRVEDCGDLEYLFPFFIAKHLPQLEAVTIKNAEKIKEIVSKREEPLDNPFKFEFHRLTSMVLWNLQDLQGFCVGNHSLSCSSLKELDIYNCEKLKLFKTQGASGQGRLSDENLHFSMQRLFTLEEATEESSSINEQSSQTHQKSVSTSRAFSLEEHESESKVDEIVDSGKQEMHKLPIPDSGIETQKICEIIETTLDRTSQSSFTKVAAAIGTGEKNETIQTPFADAIESKLTHTSVQETAGLALGTQDETIEEPLVQATHQGTLSPGIVRDTDNRNQEMYKTLVPVTQNVLSSSMVDNIALHNQEMHGISVERPLVQATKIALITTTGYDAAGGSQDLQLHPSENLLVQITTSITDHDKENIGTKEMHETIQRPLVQNAGVMLIPASSVQDIATETHVAHDAWDITIVPERESHDTDIHLSKNLFHQTSTSMVANHKETIETQETESKRRFSVHDAQNVSSPTNVYNAGKSDEPEITLGNNLSCQTKNSVMAARRAAPSQPSKAPSSFTTIADVCSSFKELDISVQLLPYLEAGVKRHPQVLNWLNTKRRRVFASFSFSLFAEVTLILRTTRRVDLSEDDRNYIRECCIVLQGFGFDDGWISYVHGRIDKCGDEEDLEWKVEEAEAQLESMKKESASMEESLVLLRDKASRLHGYIYLSTLINALLFTILFFIIIHVY